MPYAVELYFEAEATQKLRASSYRLTGFEQDMQPHVSLAVFETCQQEDIKHLLTAFARETSAFRLKFAAIGSFPGTEGVIFLAPVVSQDLLTLHQRFHRHLSLINQSSLAYYVPGQWVPHCTLAFGVPDENIAGLMQGFRLEPLFDEVQVTEIGLIKARPFADLFRVPLSG